MQEAVVAVCMKGIKDVLAGRSPHAGIDIEVLQGGPVPFSSNTPVTHR